MKKVLYGALAFMLAATTACSDNGDNNQLPEETKGSKVLVKIDNIAAASSRAVTDPKGESDAEKVEFTGGYLFFLTPQGAIRDHVRIIVDPADVDNFDCQKVTVQELREGKLFEGVSGDVTSVYVLANTGSFGNDLHNGTIKFISDVESRNISIKDQWEDNMSHVALSGEAMLYETSEVGTKSAKVELVPLCARLEIAKITPGPLVVDYKVEGIYLAGFYDQMPINQMCLQADWKSPDYEAVNIPDALSTFYAAYPFMADTQIFSRKETFKDQDDNDVERNAFYPVDPESDQAGKVWAYPFFGIEEKVNDPYTRHLGLRLIIRLSHIKVYLPNNEGNLVLTEIEGDRYINISRFVDDASNPHASAVRFYNGHVYQVKFLEITANNISDKIIPTDINVQVEISVKPWQVTPVYPTF
jgi:hypothetical protein